MTKEFCFHCRKPPNGDTKQYTFTDGITFYNGRPQRYLVQLHDSCVAALMQAQPHVQLSAA